MSCMTWSHSPITVWLTPRALVCSSLVSICQAPEPPRTSFALGREEVEYDSGNFLGRGTAEEREQGYTPVLAHLGCVCCEHYSSHSSMPQTHFALVRIRSLFRPVFPKTTCFRGAMYFKLVFHVNRKIINCSCLDTFQGRKPSFSPMRRNVRGCNSSGTAQKVGYPRKKVCEFSRFSAELFQ